MNNFNEINNIKYDIQKQISQMKGEAKRMMDNEKKKINEIQEDQDLIGRDLFYIPTWIDDNASIENGIIKTANGTYYRHRRDIPKGLESMAVSAKYSATPLGVLSVRFRSIYLIVPSDESIGEQFSNKSEYILEDPSIAIELVRYLRSLDRDIELEGDRIFIYKDTAEVNQEIQEFINNKRMNEMMSMSDTDEDIVDIYPNNYISGDTEI